MRFRTAGMLPDLTLEGYDDCGLIMLAGRSVGASFDGAFAPSLGVAELVRLALGERAYEVIDGDL